VQPNFCATARRCSYLPCEPKISLVDLTSAQAFVKAGMGAGRKEYAIDVEALQVGARADV
jgi:hypothetical protein